MTAPTQAKDHIEPMDLTPQERDLIQTLRLLRQLEPTTPQQVEEFVWSLVARYLKWDWSDPASMEMAVKFMGLDPFLRRESEAISADFACTLQDGLEGL